jgi:tetraacyldisaccharide 4'-kinase
VSRAFRLVLRAREKLYRSGLLPTLHLNHPVISVGNLTLGGTGKTPLVVALAEALRDRGFLPVILSRGYGRISKGVSLVGSDGRQWEQWGDEPFLMRQRLGNVPVVVGANRYDCGRLAEQKQLGNIFLLDDGFQHRRLHRDVDIVTVDPLEWAAGEVLLPTGRWREPKTAVARAHAVCVQEIPGAAIPNLPVRSFIIRTEVQGIYEDDARVAPEAFEKHAVVAFAGIAKPDRFFAAVESVGIHPVKRVRFRDHYRYSARDIEKLDGEILITTEKDAVRLRTVTRRPYSYLRISVKIPDFEGLMTLVLSRLFQSGT